MKKFLLLISSLTISLSFNAQTSITITDSNGLPVANSTTIEATTTTGGLADENDFTIKNSSGISNDYNISRIDNVLSTDSTSAYFCFGTSCFPASTTITPTPYTLAANGTQSLKTYLQEGGAIGYSSVTYKVVNVANSNDAVVFTLSYNTALSVKENSDLFSSVSYVYPNPASHSAHIKLHSSANVKNAELKIINTLGTVVSTTYTELNTGENTVNYNTENLPSGMYFSTISYGKNKIVKKLRTG